MPTRDAPRNKGMLDYRGVGLERFHCTIEYYTKEWCTGKCHTNGGLTLLFC